MFVRMHVDGLMKVQNLERTRSSRASSVSGSGSCVPNVWWAQRNSSATRPDPASESSRRFDTRNFPSPPKVLWQCNCHVPPLPPVASFSKRALVVARFPFTPPSHPSSLDRTRFCENPTPDFVLVKDSPKFGFFARYLWTWGSRFSRRGK